MKFLFVAFISFLIVACSGYKPVPEYSNEIFEQPVLTKVKMDAEDPDAGVYLQDEISKMAVNRLNLSLTKSVKRAKGYILVNSYTINTTPVNTDDNGSVIRYSVNAAIEFAIKDKYGFWSKNIVSSEYVSVKPQSLVSALDKEKASKVAIQKALDTFILAVIKRSRDIAKKEEKVKENTQNQTNSENIISDSMQDNTSEANSSDIRIVPLDDNNTLIKDATNYN